MPSQFFGLNTAYLGLLASNAALNTTSNNISNVQTAGYSRQQVVQQASDAIRVFQTYGCAGAGVDTIAIERIRDEFYDSKYWNSNTSLGEYSSKQYYMQQIETYFTDDGKATGFQTVFDQFMITGLQAVMKDASSSTSKAQFVGYASSLTEYFKSMASNLASVQKDINQEIKLKVDEINSISSEIAALNKQINVIEMSGGTANELRDRRTLLVDQLSAIVDVEIIETPIVDSNNADRKTGGNNYMLKIAGGQLLVNTNDYKQLECVARGSNEKVNQSDIDGLYDIKWSDGQEFNMYNSAMGGNLQGLIEMRDGNNGENFKGTISGVGTTTVGGVSHDTVTIKVDQSYLQDLNKSNLSDTGGVINLGNQLFYYDSWSYTCEYDADGNASYSYTFTMSDSELNERRITNDRVGKSASIGSSIAYQGVPYYMNQMNEWVRTFAQHFNDILTSGYDVNGNQGIQMFTGNNAGGEEYTLGDDTRYDLQKDGTLTVGSSSDSYYKLTASNFTVLAAMIADGDLLATKKDPADGVEQFDILTQLGKMVNDKTQMSFRGCSANEFLQCMLSDVGLNAGNANTFKSNYTNICKSIDNQRISISGVDEDEEAVNLVKFQNAYNLASKMVQTLTEVYDRLILETGV